QIAGNGSFAGSLRWYVDRSGETLPRPWAVSVPLVVYRLAMLAWALWIAQALLGWLRWGWDAYTAGGTWPPPRGLPGRRGGRRAGPCGVTRRIRDMRQADSVKRHWRAWGRTFEKLLVKAYQDGLKEGIRRAHGDRRRGRSIRADATAEGLVRRIEEHFHLDR